MKKYSVIIILLGFLVVGCKEKESGYDARRLLERVRNNSVLKDNNDIIKNIDRAISENENHKVNSVPIIIWAFLLGPHGGKPNHLDVFYYDEEKDALGIGIKEKILDSDGKENILIEEYPVLIFRGSPTMTPGISMPIQIRNSGQRKSDRDWNNYMKSEGIEKKYLAEWQKSLPDVWISIPEPNKVEVEMYIYDQDGNKSNATIVHCEEWIEGVSAISN
jgi:hypothetical protein